MATHSGVLAWKIPWMEEPGGLQPMGSLRVGHDWVISLSLFTFIIGEGNGNPLQCSCLENPRDGGAWWAAIYGIAQSQTRLKRLSSSCSKIVILSLPFPGSTSPILSKVIDVDRFKTPSLFWLFFFIWILARQFHTQVFSSIYWQRDCPQGHWEVIYRHM